MPDFLVSTFKRLLKVSLTDAGDLIESQTVAEGCGVYFGLEQKGPFIFVAERNVDIHKKPVTPGAPQNVVRVFLKLGPQKIIRLPLKYTAPNFDDLHQIRRDKGAMFVSTAKYPFIIRKPLFIGPDMGVDLRQAVPKPYIRKNDQNHDAYHFNSIAVTDEHLYVLAHNWDLPSFVVRISLDSARKGIMQDTKVFEDVGFCCHDIVPDNSQIWVLDSGGSALVCVHTDTSHMDRYPIHPEEGQQDSHGKPDIPFPRGLCKHEDMLIIGYGFNESREERMNSEARLAVFDMKTKEVTNHINLGRHGNTCAVMPLT